MAYLSRTDEDLAEELNALAEAQELITLKERITNIELMIL